MPSPVRILGFPFALPTPYASGHSCTSAEAEALNRILVRGLAKGLYKVLEAGIRRSGFSGAAAMSEDIRSDVAAQGEEYVSDFCLGFSQGHDYQRAVRVESDRIARGILETRLYAQGKKSSDLEELVLREELAKLAGSEKVRSEAERRVRVTKEIAERAHDELLESLGN